MYCRTISLGSSDAAAADADADFAFFAAGFSFSSTSASDTHASATCKYQLRVVLRWSGSGRRLHEIAVLYCSDPFSSLRERISSCRISLQTLTLLSPSPHSLSSLPSLLTGYSSYWRHPPSDPHPLRLPPIPSDTRLRQTSRMMQAGEMQMYVFNRGGWCCS